MTFRDRVWKLYRWLVLNWNALAAGVSLGGVALVSIISPLQKYRDVFIFAAANALVWTLVEIKLQLGHQPKAGGLYPSMRSARSDVLEAIWSECSQARGKTTEIRIIGGRLRSAGDIVREIAREIGEGRRAVSNLSIDVYCLDPTALTVMRMPGKRNQDQQASRNASYAQIVSGFRDELLAFNDRETFRRANVTISVTYYTDMPAVYCYLIGSTMVYWSGCTWDVEESDFQGSGNPCFCLSRTEQGYGELCAWLENRMSMYDAAAQGAPSGL